MIRTIAPALLTLVGLGCHAAEGVEAQALRLAHVFSDHGVLQRDKPLPVWGWAAPEAVVKVTLGSQSRDAKAGADGRWSVTFDALKSGDPAIDLAAASGGATAKAVDLLIGEVWVCSGQSNMEWSVQGSLNPQAEIAAADLPRIRLLTVPKNSSATPVADINATWTVCSPQTVAGFSAVGFFFGRELATTLDVPIGLIHSSWGGTPAQSWTSREVLAAEPSLAGYVKAFDDAMANYPVALAKMEEELKNKKTTAIKLDDAGWEKSAPDAAEWKDMKLPQQWEKAGLRIDGTVWFLRAVEVSADAAGKDLALSLGPIDDQDTTWWDGERIGGMATWNAERKYTVPAKLATAGRHVIAIRVVDTGGGGGVFGAPEQLSLGDAADGTKTPLAGTWRYRVAEEVPERAGPPMGPGNPWLPTSLRNGMITPIIPYAIRGAIWYQGESNAGGAWQYRTLFPAMISDWRAAWKQGDFPFLFVQLANFTQPPAQPGDNEWAELRDAQFNTLRTLPATGMASAIDIGEAADIHPKNKQDVGRRLARWALADTYGTQIESSGPLYTAAKVEDGRIRISFDHLGGGLEAKGGALAQFAIAGEDKKWVWADAVIDGDTVVVSSAAVAKPLAVRYAWSANPAGCNLYNKAGLPASPFRTDDWQAITDRK